VNEPIEDSNTDELTTVSGNKANIWTAYKIQYDTTENTQENLHELNPNAKIFISFNVANQKITAPITPLDTEEQQNPLNVIAPTRRSDA